MNNPTPTTFLARFRLWGLLFSLVAAFPSTGLANPSEEPEEGPNKKRPRLIPAAEAPVLIPQQKSAPLPLLTPEEWRDHITQALTQDVPSQQRLITALLAQPTPPRLLLDAFDSANLRLRDLFNFVSFIEHHVTRSSVIHLDPRAQWPAVITRLLPTLWEAPILTNPQAREEDIMQGAFRTSPALFGQVLNLFIFSERLQWSNREPIVHAVHTHLELIQAEYALSALTLLHQDRSSARHWDFATNMFLIWNSPQSNENPQRAAWARYLFLSTVERLSGYGDHHANVIVQWALDNQWVSLRTDSPQGSGERFRRITDNAFNLFSGPRLRTLNDPSREAEDLERLLYLFPAGPSPFTPWLEDIDVAIRLNKGQKIASTIRQRRIARSIPLSTANPLALLNFWRWQSQHYRWRYAEGMHPLAGSRVHHVVAFSIFSDLYGRLASELFNQIHQSRPSAPLSPTSVAASSSIMSPPPAVRHNQTRHDGVLSESHPITLPPPNFEGPNAAGRTQAPSSDPRL